MKTDDERIQKHRSKGVVCEADVTAAERMLVAVRTIAPANAGCLQRDGRQCWDTLRHQFQPRVVMVAAHSVRNDREEQASLNQHAG